MAGKWLKREKRVRCRVAVPLATESLDQLWITVEPDSHPKRHKGER